MELSKDSIEIEIGKGKRKFFILIHVDPISIWIDTKSLPQTAFLCALCDSIPFLEAEVGPKKKEKRIFFNIEWAINDWGGDKELVNALKIRKQKILDDIPNLREKYAI